MTTKNKNSFALRKQRLLRNMALILSILLLLWISFGMPALNKRAAWNQLLDGYLLPHTNYDMELSATPKSSILLKEIDGQIYQGTVKRDSLFIWRNSGMLTITPNAGDAYIIPLLLAMDDGSQCCFAVKADCDMAELTLEMEGMQYPLTLFNKKADYFLFMPDASLKDQERSLRSLYYQFIYYWDYTHMDDPRGCYKENYAYPGRLIFKGYDAEGRLVSEAEREL